MVTGVGLQPAHIQRRATRDYSSTVDTRQIIGDNWVVQKMLPQRMVLSSVRPLTYKHHTKRDHIMIKKRTVLLVVIALVFESNIKLDL